MVLLTAIVTPLAILASWRMDDRPHVITRSFCGCKPVCSHVHRAEFFPLVSVLGTRLIPAFS